jgi:hypothetical protein
MVCGIQPVNDRVLSLRGDRVLLGADSIAGTKPNGKNHENESGNSAGT